MCSQGAQVLSRLIRKWENDPTAPSPDRVLFLLAGNPLRNPTGKGVGGREFDGGKGVATPDDSRYRVIDVARQGDAWAIRRPWWSLGGWLSLVAGAHLNYKVVDLNGPGNTVVTRGRMTWVTAP